MREAVYGMDLMRHLESTGVRESGMLVDVHVDGFQDDWRFNEIPSVTSAAISGLRKPDVPRTFRGLLRTPPDQGWDKAQTR